MKIEFEGRTWEFDPNTITVKQAVAIWYAHKLTIHEYLEALGKLDGRGIQVAYWLMLQQSGVIKPLADVDCDAIAFMAAYGDAAEAEAAAEKAAQEAQREPEPLVPTSPPPGDQAWPGRGYQTAMTPQHVVPLAQPVPVPTGY